MADPAPTAAEPAKAGWSLATGSRNSLREVSLRHAEISLGGRGCDVALPGAAGATEQARLRLQDNAARLTLSPSSAPACLHGLDVRVATLRDGDSFRLGD